MGGMETPAQEAAWRARTYGEEKETAPAEAKPFFDILGLWNIQGTPGLPDTDSEYAAATEKLIQDWSKNKGLPLSLFLPGKSPITPAEAPAEASSIIDRGIGLVSVLNTIGIVAEAASLGQIESVIWGITNVVNTSGLPGVVGSLYRVPVDIGVKIPLERRMNSIYQPQIPDVGTLSALRARGMLEEGAYNSWMSEHGFPSWAADLTAYAKTRMPGLNDLLSLLRRGWISGRTFGTWLRRGGMDPNVVGSLQNLRYQLPGYQDLIGIYMREGHLPQKWVEIPQDFITFMDKQGYDFKWALRLWGKHWVLPGVNLLYDMLHKGIIDAATMTQMLRYHDFEPVWRQRLIDNAYNMVPRVDLRRAYRYGSLGAGELTQRYKWLGYKPVDAALMSGIAQRWSLDRYYTRLETVARAAFRSRQIDATGLARILVKVNTPLEAIPLILEAEMLARTANIREVGEDVKNLTASQVLRLYQLQIRTKTWVQGRLESQGFSSTDAALLIRLYEPRIEAVEINRDLITASSALYKEGLMDPAEYKGRLRKAGLSESEITDKKEAEDLRYRLDYARDLITMAKEAYRKDVWTYEEFEGQLLAYGMQPQRVAALSALEQLRKVPKPRPA